MTLDWIPGDGNGIRPSGRRGGIRVDRVSVTDCFFFWLCID
ncbi:MAG TPA: hypothetical protein PK360_02765 [bacterium]|nr:hypothetical protein [bacterium]